jgi:hypothetical protein
MFYMHSLFVLVTSIVQMIFSNIYQNFLLCPVLFRPRLMPLPLLSLIDLFIYLLY